MGFLQPLPLMTVGLVWIFLTLFEAGLLDRSDTSVCRQPRFLFFRNNPFFLLCICPIQTPFLVILTTKDSFTHTHIYPLAAQTQPYSLSTSPPGPGLQNLYSNEERKEKKSFQQQSTHNKSERNQHISIHEEMTQPHEIPVKDKLNWLMQN